jgi:FkbM family methyltransferase
VGANHGQSILSITLVNPGARIVAFEPNVRLAEKIRRRWRGSERILIHAVGLSDREEVLSLHVPAYRGMIYDGLASLDPQEALQWLNSDAIYGFNPAHVTLEATACSLRPLDSFAFSQPAYFIKIDVQGHESKVLAGAAARIAADRPVVLVEGVFA